MRFSLTSKWLWLTIAGVLLVAGGVAGVVATRSGDGSGSAATPSASSSDTATDTSGTPAGGQSATATSSSSSATDTAQSSTTTGSATTNGGKTGTSSGSTTPNPGKQTSSQDAVGDFYLRVSWWNDTQRKSPRGFTIKWGSGSSWTADAAKASEVATIGPFVRGRALQLKIYPEGLDGSVATVPFQIGAKMLSGSKRDGIHVEIRDDNLRVLGNPVRNFELDFPRL